MRHQAKYNYKSENELTNRQKKTTRLSNKKNAWYAVASIGSYTTLTFTYEVKHVSDDARADATGKSSS